MTQAKIPLWQRLFINRDYALLFWGRLVSQIGDGIYYFALTWLVLDLTGSGAALGTLLFASSLPAILLAPFTGVLADMWDRKTIVVSMDVIRGLVLLSLAGIYYAGYLTLPVLYIATILSSLCGVLFGPAISASIPEMVEKDELVRANALNNLSRSATGIIGPVAGALLLGAVGYFGVFLINGISFLLSAVSETFIRFPKVEQMADSAAEGKSSIGTQFLNNLKEGFVYIWSNAGLRTIILFAIVLNFMASPVFGVIFPYFGKEVLQMEPQHYGMTQSSLPVGLMVGTLMIGLLTQKIRKDRLLAVGIVGQGLIVSAVSILALPAVYQVMSPIAILISLVVPIFMLGVLNIFVNVPFQVMLQETVPNHYRGRVFGLLDSMVQILVPVSMALFGVLVDAIPPFYFFLMMGLSSIVLGAAMGLSANIRSMYDEPTVTRDGMERQV